MLASRLRRLFGQDYRWVIPQLALMPAAVAAAPVEAARFGRRFGPLHPIVGLAAGGACLAGAAWVAERARRDLAENLTMSPTPVTDGQLVDHGVYGVVRHPMYAAVMLGLLGNALAWGSTAGLTSTGLTGAFLAFKTRHEEERLVRWYPGYLEYRARVRWRFIPGLL